MKIICLFKKDYLRNENIVRTTKVYHTAVVVQNFIENLCQSPVEKWENYFAVILGIHHMQRQEVEYYSSFSKFLYYSPICISTNKRDMNIFYTNILTRIVYLKWKNSLYFNQFFEAWFYFAWEKYSIWIFPTSCRKCSTYKLNILQKICYVQYAHMHWYNYTVLPECAW